ncbi:hypothetical protein [Cetobacterium sp.]|uniref:hypothetical protein n=1 Tax=Cetobacterium sp. TaxID=2071632 RepID=UPI003F3F5E68
MDIKKIIIETYMDKNYKEVELLPKFSNTGGKASSVFVEKLQELMMENPNLHIKYCEEEKKEFIFIKDGNDVKVYDYDKVLAHWLGYIGTLIKITGTKSFFNQEKCRTKSKYDFIKGLLEEEQGE